jgi:hypothetical protein
MATATAYVANSYYLNVSYNFSDLGEFSRIDQDIRLPSGQSIWNGTSAFTSRKTGTLEFEVSSWGVGVKKWDPNVAYTVILKPYSSFEGILATVSATTVVPKPTYSINSLRAAINEGGSADFQVTTTNVAPYTLITYTITGVDKTDILGNVLTGTTVVGADGKAIINVPVKADRTTEGEENLTVTVQNVSASSIIKDTSSGYVGEFKDDRFNGQGTFTFASGDKYVGEFKDDKYNGQGTYTFASGDKYVGEFKDDRFNGQGTYTFANGEVWSGTWINDSLAAPIYSLKSQTASVEEGSTVNFELVVANYKSGSNVSYRVSGLGVSSVDVVGGKLSGTTKLDVNGRAVISVPINADATLEGLESLTITVEGRSASIQIIDTSWLTLSTSVSSIKEGEQAAISLKAEGVEPGAGLTYKIEGISKADLSYGNLTSTVEVGEDGTATIVIPTAIDTLTEGTETLTLTVNGQKVSIAVLDDTSVRVGETIFEGPDVTLYKVSRGGHVLAAPGLGKGEVLDDFVSLKASAMKDYALPKGLSAVLGYEDGGYGLIIATGTGAKARFYEQKFNEAGIAVGNAAKLTVAQVLEKETLNQTDINSDGVIGDVITLVLDGDGDENQQDFGLYSMSSGTVALGEAGLSKGDSLDNSITLMASMTKVWTMPAGSSAARIAFTDGGSLEVLILRGKQYSAQKFDAETGLIKGKATALKTAQIDAREYYYNLDLTGDGDISLVGQETMPVGWAT